MVTENSGPTHVAYKSSVTGEFVSKDFAEKHPRTTFKTNIPDREVITHNDENENEDQHNMAPDAPATMAAQENDDGS